MNHMVKTAGAAWMEVAKGEIGTTQYPVGQSNPRISEYREAPLSRISIFIGECVTSEKLNVFKPTLYATNTHLIELDPDQIKTDANVIVCSPSDVTMQRAPRISMV